jgi:HEAT repeat protein
VKQAAPPRVWTALAVALGLAAAPVDGKGTEFETLLRAPAPERSAEELDRAARELAETPRAVVHYLSLAAGDPTVLDPEQRALLERTARFLPAAEVTLAVQRGLEGEPSAAWRGAALGLMATHARAPDLASMIKLLPPRSEDAEQLLPAFRSALVEIVRRDPATVEQLSSMGYVERATALEVVRAVGRAGVPRGVAWLTEQLREPDLVDVALLELQRLAPALPSGRSATCAAAVRPWLAAPEPGRRRRAGSALVALRDTSAIPGLIELLESADASERKWVWTALRDLSGCALPDNPEAWRHWYEQEQQWWKEQAPATFERLESEDEAQAVAAVRAVAERGLRRDLMTAELVRALRRHPSPVVRRQACAGLQRLGSRHALEGLVRALRDPDERVRAQAHQALAAITGLSPAADAEAWSEALSAP